MAKGFGVAALICALLAIVIPIVGIVVSGIAIVLAIVAAFSGDRAFATGDVAHRRGKHILSKSVGDAGPSHVTGSAGDRSVSFPLRGCPDRRNPREKLARQFIAQRDWRSETT